MLVIRNCTLLLLLYFSALLNAAEFSSIVVPPFDVMNEMKLEWVAKKFIYNGYPMTIQKFTSADTSSEVLAFYQKKWRMNGRGIQDYSVIGQNYNLSYEESGYIYTVQVKDTVYGSQGILVVTKNKQVVLGDLVIPVHNNSKIVSRMRSVDDNLLAETIILGSSRSISANKKIYHALLMKDGWILQSNNVGTNSNVVMYQQRNQLCQISFVEGKNIAGGKVVMVIHWTKGIS